MKKILLLLISAVWAAGAGAQGISRVREDLARPGFMSGARVEVRERDDAAAAVRVADHNSARTTVTAYGVSLFRDNSQSTGERARAVMAQFSAMYPDIPVRLSYESPWYKVEAGLFVDRTDAVALCGRVVAQFHTAVVMQQEVLLAEMVTEMVAMEKSEPVIEIQE